MSEGPTRTSLTAGGAKVHGQSRHVDLQLAAVALLRLALGRTIGEYAPSDWRVLFDLATRERCATLAWHRSGAAIRGAAPPSVVAAWRSVAVDADARGRTQLELLAEVITATADAGCSPVVLKGIPLSMRLYGAPMVRRSADLDVHVAVERRVIAERALLDRGWKPLDGFAPWTRTFALRDARGEHFLELHSSILDVNLAHLRVPAPQTRAMTIGGLVIPAHDDDLLPAYLATHAAKHMPIALLYHVDFLTLWADLSAAKRLAARRGATDVGLGRYLEWAVRCAANVERTAAGDRKRVGLLGIGPRGRTGYHAIFRDIALARGPIDATRSVAAWLWPPHLRGTRGELTRRWLARLRKPLLDYVAPMRRSVGRTVS